MADSRTTKQNYQDIADAIRSVNGESIQYTPVEMAPAIRTIGGGVFNLIQSISCKPSI